MRRLGLWLEETHSAAFELRRHFFRRFFDSDLVSTPGQWQVVAGGALAVLLSLSLIFTQAYYHKYVVLNKMDSADPQRLATVADVLFVITLAMLLLGLFTTFQWPSLFPGLRDYLALASLPVRMRQIFVAKFTALVTFAGLVIVAVTLLPSVILPAVMGGRYSSSGTLQAFAIFVSSSAGAAFVFFSLVAAQGILLNLLPTRQFSRVSLAIQGALLTVLLCGLALVFSIPSLAPSMDHRPDWIFRIPPAWFLGLHQVIMGNREPAAIRLAWMSLTGSAAASFGAMLTYLWSYRRHRERVIEAPTSSPNRVRQDRMAAFAASFIRDSRELAVFAFIAKTLARSRQHRLVITTFAGLAVAVIFEGFAGIALNNGLHSLSMQNQALREAAISAPLSLSMFVLAGLRYLFRLPVELRANWVFRVNELGNRRRFLAGVERFLLCYAVAPVGLLALVCEVAFFGVRAGFLVAAFCLLPCLALMELLLIRFEKIPFTSAYLPGQRPVIETVVIYGVSVALYVSSLSGIINYCVRWPDTTLILFTALLGIWWIARRVRLEDWKFGSLEFEELMEPAVRTLSIERD